MELYQSVIPLQRKQEALETYGAKLSDKGKKLRAHIAQLTKKTKEAMMKDSKVDFYNKKPTDVYPKLTSITKTHIDSFNWLVEHALPAMLPMRVEHNLSNGSYFAITLQKLSLAPPVGSDNRKLYPHECREAQIAYSGALTATINFELDGENIQSFEKNICDLPIMVKSNYCYLKDMTMKELVDHKEEETEMGGYFIIEGYERVIRTLIGERSNYPLAHVRSPKGEFADKHIFVRCVRRDGSSKNNEVRFLNDGSAKVGFHLRMSPFQIDVIYMLKCFRETNDEEIYTKVIGTNVDEDDANEGLTRQRVEYSLRKCQREYPMLKSREDFLTHLGDKFRHKLPISEHTSNRDAGQMLIDEYIFPHLSTGDDKFNFLIFCLQKLYSFVNGEVIEDSREAASNWEVVTAGQSIAVAMRDRIFSGLLRYRLYLQKVLAKINKASPAYKKVLLDVVMKVPFSISASLRNFFTTGNLGLTHDFEPSQTSGLSIIAENLNYFRYTSHYTSIHRGSSFQEMKITAPRKLRPEAWGFICPVHTPDGSPCGLLNHLSSSCEVVPEPQRTDSLMEILVSLGMSPVSLDLPLYSSGNYVSVLIDGRIVGKVKATEQTEFADRLRYLKARGMYNIPRYLEIASVPRMVNGAGAYNGIYIFALPHRFARPVVYLPTGDIEYIGSLEQIYLNIAVVDDEVKQGVTTHKETDPKNMLSELACLTPFSDFNQSPRNVYQCQMAKQTMAIPFHSFPHRYDNRIYRLHVSQKPLVTTQMQQMLPYESHPSGMNAIVAVIANTGYDMEDAMIINKGSYERGFAFGSMYKTITEDMYEIIGIEPGSDISHYRFDNRITVNASQGTYIKHEKGLDFDGLPAIGQRLVMGSPLYCIYDERADKFIVFKYKYMEPCYIDRVKLIANKDGHVYKAEISYRYNRNPIIGDKFSSRHGQKGVLSMLWPQENMPFSDSGITPDVIINPHAFPSRMTIGMLIEMMSAKSACLHGYKPDASPFQFDENNRAVDYFGEQLRAAGYNYYGNETLYSGTLGIEYQADIYFGVCYYQRLRHMVNDKYQARATGQFNAITHQPVGGRKRQGAVRLGEMERDSLLGHGTSFMLQDRLFHCSDADNAYICRQCGGMIGTTVVNRGYNKFVKCQFCDTTKHIVAVGVPHVVKYLAAELAAMNIRLKIETD